MMVYKFVRIIANGGNEENVEECEETEQTIQALFNLVQIKFMVVQSQVNEANELQDASVINEDFLIETQETLQLLLQRIEQSYGAQNILSIPEYEQSEQMLSEINGLLT